VNQILLYCRNMFSEFNLTYVENTNIHKQLLASSRLILLSVHGLKEE
jgi:hypothetical protein